MNGPFRHLSVSHGGSSHPGAGGKARLYFTRLSLCALLVSVRLQGAQSPSGTLQEPRGEGPLGELQMTGSRLEFHFLFPQGDSVHQVPPQWQAALCPDNHLCWRDCAPWSVDPGGHGLRRGPSPGTPGPGAPPALAPASGLPPSQQLPLWSAHHGHHFLRLSTPRSIS